MRKKNIMKAEVPAQGMHLHIIPIRASIDSRWKERSGLWIDLTAEEVVAIRRLIADTPCRSVASYVAVMWHGHETLWSCPIPWSTGRQITTELERVAE